MASTINGGIKFFQNSKTILNTLAGGTATATASSGNAAAGMAIDRNNYTVWSSVGSDDLTTETWTAEVDTAVTINRIFLIDHNFKNYNIQYWDGAAWQDFTFVFGIDGAVSGGIYETFFNQDTAYYEFVDVTTTKIRIQVLSVQTMDDAEKYLNSFIATFEIGTFQGFPDVSSTVKDKNIRNKKTLNGRVFVQKSIETKQYTIDFKNYPGKLTIDLNLAIFLFDYDETFLIWLCGGRYGAPYFSYQFVGFRLRDVVPMQVTNKFNDKYSKNFYNGGVNLKMKLEESF